MQTSYSTGPTPAIPGMPYDPSSVASGDVVSIVAGVVIPFGVLCELSGGKLQPVQDTNANWPPTGTAAGTSLVGISLQGGIAVEQGYLTPPVPASTAGSTSSGWPVGFIVPVMRRGRIWMSYDNTGTATAIGSVNVWHSSDGTHAQGVATFAATATTAGAEVSTAGAYLESFNPDGTQAGSFTDGWNVANGVLAVTINLPGGPVVV
jgi:hypothetical protein